jgi:hypothetical protein
MDLESPSGKPASGARLSTSASFDPALAAVGETGSNESSTKEPDVARDASQVTPSQPAEVLAAIATSSRGEQHAVAVADSNTPDDYDPPDAAGNQLGLNGSPPFSPASAERIDSEDAHSGGSQETASPPTMPTQISIATMPNDDPTVEARAEFFAQPAVRTADTFREVHTISSIHRLQPSNS